MNKAAQNRQIAMGMIVELYLPTYDDPDYERDIYLCNFYEGRYATADEIADNIIKLSQLGRTQRWQSAIACWAGMVRAQTTIKGIRWAFLQGIVNVNFASE